MLYQGGVGVFVCICDMCLVTDSEMEAGLMGK